MTISLTAAFVIGNGESRQAIDLNILRGKGTIIGCNALYRDFEPDVLIAIDQKMLIEIEKSDYFRQGNYFVTHTGKRGVTKFKLNFGKFNTSGCVALKYAGIVKIDIAYLLGFDCYGGNLYTGSPNYAQAHLNPNRYKAFRRFYEVALKEYPKTKYINVIKNNQDGLSEVLRNLPNYDTVDMDIFIDNLSRFPQQKVIKAHDESGQVLIYERPYLPPKR